MKEMLFLKLILKIQKNFLLGITFNIHVDYKMGNHI